MPNERLSLTAICTDALLFLEKSYLSRLNLGPLLKVSHMGGEHLSSTIAPLEDDDAYMCLQEFSDRITKPAVSAIAANLPKAKISMVDLTGAFTDSGAWDAFYTNGDKTMSLHVRIWWTDKASDMVQVGWNIRFDIGYVMVVE